MPQIPRYTSFQQGTAGGAQISPQTAAAPARAMASAANNVRQTTNEFLQAKVNAERTTEIADRLTNAMQAMEDWTAEQNPYDDQGKPRFDRLQDDAQKAWSGIYKQAMDGVRDPVVSQRLDLRLKDYNSRKRIDISKTANQWEINHRSGQLESSLYKLSDLASRAQSYDMVERYLADASQAVKGAVTSGIVTPESGVKLERKFNQDMMSGYVRNQIYSGNYGEAAATLQQMYSRDPGEMLTNSNYTTLLKEMVTESDRQRKAAEREQKQAVEDTAVNYMVRAADGENMTGAWHNLAASGAIHDRETYIAVDNALRKAQDGADDADVVRWLSDRYATGSLKLSDLASVSGKVSTNTYKSFAIMLKNSSSHHSSTMFDDDVFKKGESMVRQGLKQSGALASFTDAERTLIPRAVREYTMEMQTRWNQHGSLDYVDATDFANSIVSRYEDTMFGGSSGMVPPPRFKAPKEVEEAYTKGELGPPGTKQSMDRLQFELESIKKYELYKARTARRDAQRGKNGLNSMPSSQ